VRVEQVEELALAGHQASEHCCFLLSGEAEAEPPQVLDFRGIEPPLRQRRSAVLSALGRRAPHRARRARETRRRRGLLDAVVFSGGEPTLQRGLAQSAREVKALGFLVGLHTAGIVPRRLAEVLPLVDWVAMDVKAKFDEHERVTGVRGSAHRARESRELILASGTACEFHTIS